MVPVYPAVVLLLEGMKSVAGLVKPFAALLPDTLPAEPPLSLLRSRTQRLAGRDVESSRKPALAEIEEALVPAFTIEELADGR